VNVPISPRALPPALRPVRPLVALVLISALLSACSAGKPSAGAAERSPAASPSPTAAAAPASPIAAAPAPAPKNPLTGVGPVPKGAVVAVKIDNSPLARPYHRGLDKASLVYTELMEGGATRFFAVFAPGVSSEVGPIRSVRESDLELITQFGRIALGASGGNAGVLASVVEAEKQGVLLDANFERLPGPYRKGERRKDAINFFTSPAALDLARPGGTWPKDIGLRFGPLPPGAGQPAARAGVRFSKIARMSVQYDPASGRYAVFENGDRIRGAAPANVVVQHVQIRQSRYVDVLGNRTPYTVSVGEGPAVVLRNGRRVSGTWSRPAQPAGTRLLDDKRRDIPLEPGPTWFLLVPAGAAMDVG
jgi:hypothetical protein